MTRRAFLSTTGAATAAAANARDFDITDHSARDDGHDCTAAIAKAIAACSAAGGGRVVVPPGSFFTGPSTSAAA